jgi:hypothetical protein
MRNPIILCALLALGAARICAASDPAADDCAWQELFNGHDLTGWTPKLRGYPAGEDPFNTFRVTDGLLSVVYDAYDGFQGHFGHLFYARPFSRYRLQLEYRFVGDQVDGGPDWAWRNSGAMLHCPAPADMEVEQDFPLSIEVQILGGRGDGSVRHTGNLCTPGSNVVYAGSFDTRHCIESSSATFDGDRWVHLEVIVQGADSVTHLINGQEVMRYGDPSVGDESVTAEAAALAEPMSSGYIALQGESHPVQFRNIRLLDLEACP